LGISLIDKLRDVPLAFVDVETTGASTDFGDRVVEIGIVRVEGGCCVAEYQQLVDPQRHIGPGISALTGITNAMVVGQPLFNDILPRVIELMSGCVVIGHNVHFDLSFLTGEFRRCCQPIHECLETCKHVLDTVRIARRRFGRGGNGLQRLAPRLGVMPTAAHRALADAVTTFGVFEKLMEPAGGWEMCLCDAIAQQGGPMGLLPASPRESLLPLELQEALEQKAKVLMEYVDGDEHKTERIIEPLQVRKFNGELQLVAHCYLRNERRNFKLDRIVRLKRIEPEAPAPVGGQMTFDQLKEEISPRSHEAHEAVSVEVRMTANQTISEIDLNEAAQSEEPVHG
jgi:DNA polymerase III epsilon subunit family exonuclease